MLVHTSVFVLWSINTRSILDIRKVNINSSINHVITFIISLYNGTRLENLIVPHTHTQEELLYTAKERKGK